MSDLKTSGLIRNTIKKLVPLVGLLLLGANLHAVQASEKTLTEILAGINAGFNNVELELLEWPGELHNQLGQIDKYAFVTRPLQSSGKLPLIISLHGGGESFQNLSLETQLGMDVPRGWNLAELADKEVMFLDPFIHEGWDPDNLDKMLDYVLENFSDIDKHRVYVMGYSRGGGGTYDWILQSGERFAAAAPTGFSSYRETHDFTKLESLPIWTAVGSADNDSAQRATKVKAFADHLEALGNENVDYRSYQGANHNVGGSNVYSSVELVDWMLGFTLSNQPEDWVTADQIDWFWQEGGEPTFPNEAYGPEVLVDPDKLPSGGSNVGDNQLFDVWVPDGVGPFPVYVYAHGGGFTGGSKRRMVLSGPLLQNDNVVYVDTNYRLHGGNPGGITDAINDVVALLTYLKTNKEKYKINPDQIFLGGGSAGGIIMNDITYKQKVSGIKGLWQWNLYRNEGQSVDLQDQELLANVVIPVVHAHPELYPNDNSHSALDAFDHASANWQAGNQGTFFKAIKEHPSAIGYEDPYDKIEQIWIDGLWELDSRNGTDTGVSMPNLAEWIYKVVENDNGGEIPDAGVLEFNGESYSVNESDGSVSITVQRIDGSYGDVSVDYAVTNGSAINGNDYLVTDGTLYFSNGEMNQTISIDITDDTLDENTETFSVILSNPISATLGNNQTAIVSIIDNDVPPSNDDNSNSSSGGGSFDYWLMTAMLLIARRRMLYR